MTAATIATKEQLVPRAHVTFRATQQGGMLLDVRTGSCFELNRIGAVIWARLVIGDTVQAVIEGISSAYGISMQLATADVSGICEEMLAAGLVARGDNGAL